MSDNLLLSCDLHGFGMFYLYDGGSLMGIIYSVGVTDITPL